MTYTSQETYNRDRAEYIETVAGHMAEARVRQFSEAANEAFVRDGHETAESEYAAEEKAAWEQQDRAEERAGKEFDSENELGGGV